MWWMLAKDLRLEWRDRSRINGMLFFSMLTLLLFSFAVGPEPAVLRRLAPGFLWLAILLASVVSLGESMALEVENAALEGLRLLPVNPKALFLGKALANMVCLWILGLCLVPGVVVLHGASWALGWPRLVGVLGLGTAALSAPGTLYATMAAQARARAILLPLLLFPTLVPGLVAAVRATMLVMHGDPMGEWGSWMGLLIGFNLMYWVLCTLLFARVVEP